MQMHNYMGPQSCGNTFDSNRKQTTKEMLQANLVHTVPATSCAACNGNKNHPFANTQYHFYAFACNSAKAMSGDGARA